MSNLGGLNFKFKILSCCFNLILFFSELHAENQGFAAQPAPPSLGDTDFVRRVIEAVPRSTAARGRCRDH